MPNQNGQDGSPNKDSSKTKVKLKFYTPQSNYMQIGTGSQLTLF